MSKSIDRALSALLFFFLLPSSSLSQDRSLPEENWYSDVKRALAIHYTGKTVRLKLPIPATRRGLEMVDGTLQNKLQPTSSPPQIAAKTGDELIIRDFKVRDNDIEVVLGKEEPPQKKRFPNPLSIRKQARIIMRFSRELTSKDMTIENINRVLAAAVDVSALAQAVPEKSANSPQASTASLQAEPAARDYSSVNDQNLPTPTVIGDLQAVSPKVGELTVESSAKQARVYIDGAYSGFAPRTVRLRAGAHTVLVVSDGHLPWEQKLLVPGGKASLIRADQERVMN